MLNADIATATLAIRINCPTCGARDVPAEAREEVENLYGILQLLPLFVRKRTTWVTCQSCNGKLLSRLREDELVGKSAGELDGCLSPRVYLITQVLPIVSLILAVIPAVSTLTALISLVVNWRRKNWQQWVSVVALIVSLALPLGLLTYGVLSGHFSGETAARPRSAAVR